jgi:hypothetical protein
MFDELYRDEIKPILDKKYGASWHAEQDRYFLITDAQGGPRGAEVSRRAARRKRAGAQPRFTAKAG